MEGQPNSFTERFAKSAEARIEADKLKNTHDNAVDLVKNNVDFFGRGNEEKKTEIATRILNRFKRIPPYTNFNSIIEASNDISKNPRIAHGDLDSLAESVQIAMDMSVLGEDLVTDSMTAEQIDENLPIELKGIGKRIKEKGLLDNIKNTLVEKNNIIEGGNLFTTQDKVVRGEVYRKWGEEIKTMPENSYIRKYMGVARGVFEDLGVQDGNNKKENVEDEMFRDDANELLLEMLKKIGTGVDVPPEDFIPEGVDLVTGETRESKYYSRMDITAEMLAVSMKIMDPNGARFDSYRPTEWYKKMTEKQRNVIDVMMEVNMAASATYYYGKDVDKLLGSKVNFSFSSEKMRTLFDDDLKLVLSKMFNDLCETYTDQNLHESMRYKEGFYAIPNKNDGTLVYSDREKRYVLADGRDIDDEGFLLGLDGKRIILPETQENIRDGKGKRGIAGEVVAKLHMIEDYKEEMAYFLAEHTENGFMKYSKDDKEGHKKGELMKDSKGKFIPSPMCKMYAYTAWNLWYGMGDSSLADRMRVLPTWDKIVSDGIRTLNPEYKFYSKLMIYKGGAEKKPSDLDQAEYFTGKMGDYVLQVMDEERKLAEIQGIKDGELPLKKGDKTMRRKILDGDVHLLPDRVMYGFFDFVNGGRDLVQVGSERKFYGQYSGDITKKS